MSRNMSLNLNLNRKLFNLINLLAITLSLIFCSAHGQEKLLYAGFAYASTDSNVEKLFPFTYRINKDNILSKELLKRLNQRPDVANRVTPQLGNTKVGSQISIAFALNREDFEVQLYENQYLVIVTLMSTVLAFDRATSQIVATFPVQIRYTKLFNQKPTNVDETKMISDLYFDDIRAQDGTSANAFEVWINKLSKTQIKERYPHYLQVGEFKIDQDARGEMQKASIDEIAFKNQISLILESLIASNNDVPVLPSTVGNAIGNAMTYRFSDLGSLNLKIPPANVDIQFTLRGFRKKSIDEGATKQYIYRALGNIKIVQPDLNKVYLDENIYETTIIVNPITSDLRFNDWQQYQKTLLTLMNGVSMQFRKNESKWLDEHASRGQGAAQPFKATVELFNGYR